MPELFISRLALNREASAQTLLSVIDLRHSGHTRPDIHKKLLWSAFSDSADRQRDFLWRMEKAGHYIVLSQRPPCNKYGLFHIEIHPYTPWLKEGDCLDFCLRANAVTTRSRTGQRHDVVMHALYQYPPGKRADVRMEVAQKEGKAWLERQEDGRGFTVLNCHAMNYDTIKFHRRRHPPAQFGILELQGIIQILDPDLFIVAQAQGFGKAKGFGCGLMLVKRATG